MLLFKGRLKMKQYMRSDYKTMRLITFPMHQISTVQYIIFNLIQFTSTVLWQSASCNL